MQAVTRWKIACMVLATATGVLAFRTFGANRDVRAAEVSVRSGAIPLALRRPIRVAPSVLGISQAELIDRILAARSLRDIRVLCEKLGVVGTDDAVDALSGMLGDPRPGVPQAIIDSFVAIGTERAIEAVIAATADDRDSVRLAAIAGLGGSQSEKAEQLLLELCAKPGDTAQEIAIAALGKLASDRSIVKLIELATSNDYSIASIAVAALGEASAPAAAAALRQLIDAPDHRIAAMALAAIDPIDDEVLAKVTAWIRSGNSHLVEAALAALSRKGADAFPLLREVALQGSMQTRFAAVSAIGSAGGDQAIELLGEILNGNDPRAAEAAAAQIAYLGGQHARELLIGAALSDRGPTTHAITYLSRMSGEDVEQALVSVVRHGKSADRQAALPRLLKAGNAEALQVAIDLSAKGSVRERSDAIRMLVESRSPRAFDALISVATTARGNTRVQALESLTQVQPNHPSVGKLLSEALQSGRRDEVVYAAELLSRTGTDAARQTLISALTNKNSATAEAAASALGRMGITNSVKSALLSASASSGQIKTEVMTQLVNAGAPEGITLAREMLSGKDPHSANQAIWALANRSNTPEVTQLLESALESKEATVRSTALVTLGQNADGDFTPTLLRFARDSDPQVRATALGQLGRVGTEVAQNALLGAARQGTAEDRVAAIYSLREFDNSRVGSELANFMRDPDPNVASAAISASSQAGREVDAQLVGLVNDPNAAENLRMLAAAQLRDRGSTLDPSTEAAVATLTGSADAPPDYGPHHGEVD